MSNPTTRLNYQDYRSLTTSERERYELLDGELHMVPAPNFWHQRTLSRLGVRLAEEVRGNAGGEVVFAPLDVILSERDVVQPDLIWISPERSHIIHSEGLRGAPDLVVEALSPSTSDRDRGYKRELYESHGVRELWFVSSEPNSVEVLSLADEGYRRSGLFNESDTLVSPLLPGLAVELAEVFDDKNPSKGW